LDYIAALTFAPEVLGGMVAVVIVSSLAGLGIGAAALLSRKGTTDDADKRLLAVAAADALKLLIKLEGLVIKLTVEVRDLRRRLDAETAHTAEMDTRLTAAVHDEADAVLGEGGQGDAIPAA
jgi:hypothetical protein